MIVQTSVELANLNTLFQNEPDNNHYEHFVFYIFHVLKLYMGVNYGAML